MYVHICFIAYVCNFMYIIGHVRQQIASQSKCSADDKCLTEADGKKVNTVKNILMQKQES